MKYIDFKGERISALTLGTVQLGMDYGISNTDGKPSIENAHEILRIAQKRGVTVLDTSSDYGDSEKVIGEYIAAQKTGSPFKIVTKFTVAKGSKTAEDVENSLRRTVADSLERLGVDKLDCILVHNEEDAMNYKAQIPPALKKLKDEGLIVHAGVSVNTSAAIDTILESDVYEAVQIPFNMLDTSKLRDGSIKKLSDAGMLVFVRSVFLQGLFFMDPDKLPTGVLQYAREPIEKIRALAQREGMSIAELAVSFVRDIEGISSLVLGVATPAQIEENAMLFDAPAISNKTREELLKLFDTVKPEVMMPWTWKK